MKFKGERIYSNFTRTITFWLNDSTSIDLTVRALTPEEEDELKELYKDPEPPVVTKRGGERSRDFNDPTYKTKVQEVGRQRLNYYVIKGLTATEDLEFEDLDPDDPETFHLLDKELKEANITEAMFSKIIQAALEANQITDSAIKQAEQDFLPQE